MTGTPRQWMREVCARDNAVLPVVTLSWVCIISPGVYDKKQRLAMSDETMAASRR